MLLIIEHHLSHLFVFQAQEPSVKLLPQKMSSLYNNLSWSKSWKRTVCEDQPIPIFFGRVSVLEIQCKSSKLRANDVFRLNEGIGARASQEPANWPLQAG